MAVIKANQIKIQSQQSNILSAVRYKSADLRENPIEIALSFSCPKQQQNVIYNAIAGRRCRPIH